MSRHDYIPSRQLDLQAFVENIDRTVGQNPQRFGLLIPEWQSLHERIEGFTSALRLALNSQTRNAGTLAQKALKRLIMLELLRPICMRIRDDLGVAPEDKVLLGLTLPGRSPGSIAAPQTSPILEISTEPGLVHLLRYHDQPTPDRTARAPGTTGLQLFGLLGPAPVAGQATPPPPPSGPESARFIAQVTRQHYRIQYGSADAWKTAWYWARWQTARGLVGPWSPVVTRVVAG